MNAKAMMRGEFYDASMPHIMPNSGERCPCLVGVQPLVRYSHFMINPFGGSEALCDSVHSGECITLEPADVNCPRCLPLMSGPVAKESESRWRARQAQAEREWRLRDPTSAALYDRLRSRP